MYGESIGTLNVWLRQGKALNNILWSRSGNLGNTWRYGHISIKSRFDFEIALEG